VPISGKEMVRLFEKQGYTIVKGAGKGSHVKMKKIGSENVTIPMHKELRKGTEHALKKVLKSEV